MPTTHTLFAVYNVETGAITLVLWRSVSMKKKPKAPKVESTPAAPAISATPAISPTQATIILALIPLAGYLFSLSYEATFCRYFHIPYYLISLSPTLVLSTMSYTSLPFAPLLLNMCWVIIVIPSLGKFFARTSILDTSRVSVIVFTTLFFVVLCIYGWGYLGKSVAENQKEFLVVAQSPEVVVIRGYGEYLYAVPFTRKTNEHKAQFENRLVILKMSEIPKTTPLTLEEVGPLQPAEVKPAEVKPAEVKP
jgi:hypothetical protein